MKTDRSRITGCDLRPNRYRRGGFTIIEMLIAMAVTMLLMGALAQAFKLIGERMQNSRAQVTLSNQMRGVTYQLRGHLESHTAGTEQIPLHLSQASGYFCYYEGPMHDLSTTLFGRQPQGKEDGFQDSKIGDFDDYIAFTAEAPANAWFTGKVPAFIADPSLRSQGASVALAPTVIRSKYAEIIYWISPEVHRNADGTPILDDGSGPLSFNRSGSGMPVYVDNNEDGIPDSLRLHRRILLIRPDLNFDNGTLPIYEARDSNNNLVRYGDLPIANNNLQMPYINSTNPTHPSSMQSSHWLMGLAFTNQMMDLSIRRVPVAGTGSIQGGVSSVSNLAANSLADLTAPENRFAHVRIPGDYFANSLAGKCTTMPLLALGYHPDLFVNRIPNQNNSPSRPLTWVDPPGMYLGQSTAPMMNGFLLPQFELSYAPASVTGDPRWDRTGEDVLATNVLAFDVQAYDDDAPVMLTVGNDGRPGVAGVNDVDGGSPPDSMTLEYGASGSDDIVVTANDLDVWQNLQTDCYGSIGPNINMGWSNPYGPVFTSSGDYVDLGYLFQTGGPLSAPLQALAADSNAGGSLPYSIAKRFTGGNLRSTTRIKLASSQFSGLDPSAPVANTLSHQAYANMLDSLRKSGKMALSAKYDVAQRSTRPALLFCQPVYDTWSDHYESDGFDQGSGVNGFDGTLYILNQMVSGKFQPAVSSSNNLVDEGSNGIDDNLTGGTDDASEHETSAPFASSLSSIRIRIRLDDGASREIIESSVIADLK